MEQVDSTSRFLILATLALMAMVIDPSSLAAQHTMVRKNGTQVKGEVKTLSAGQVDYLSPSDPRTLKHIPCAELAAVVDESLIVHNAPCVEPITPKSADCVRNCDALIDNNMRVTKGAITTYMDDRYVVRTRNGDVNLSRSDIVGVIATGHVDFNLTPERLQKLLADPVVISAINNTGACAMEPPTRARYSEKWAEKKFDDGLKRRPASKPAVAKPDPLNTNPVFTARDTVQRGLSDTLDFDLFKNVAMEKTKRLQTYISQITDKQLPMITKDRAVQQALSLFEPGENLVHVSNVKTGQEKTYPVESYLSTHLRRLNYDKVDIEWADLNYASEFELQPDSSYAAVISLQQRFTGYIDNKPFYSDVTNKNVTITLRTYERVTMGRTEKLWDVFLSDIGVTATKAG